ncbi:hypothetical protein Q428_00560 [Fervidicella metallireducens AeB]|uniref:Uncharacterized protein n=1 Tax=Fervidicella metallireducens AeB TaxID=1403537 RepID=A0A017S129_9CLOT|nr:hypothetical protein [Fervidicella metallireducens]EYE89880.1 hypothetical protein Q428_00560 [Fervidicella metallireducens AeB]
MKIKKQLKRDIARRKKLTAASLFIMILMVYLVAVLNDQGIFMGWEKYFAFLYVGVVNLLLFVNIVKLVSDDKFQLILGNQKVRIKDSFFKSPFNINLDKIIYIDIVERKNYEFEIVIIMEKLKRNKRFVKFDNSFIKGDPGYKKVYTHLRNSYKDKDLYCYIIKKAGARKYYYLYLLYKNSYNAEFSQLALNYVRTFMEEYNLS